MKKVLVALVALVLVCGLIGFAESDYDATSELYSVVETSNPDAAAFASDLAESNATLYEQYGIKTALCIYDSCDGDVEQFADTVITERAEQIEDTSDDLVFIVSVVDSQFTVRAGAALANLLPDDAIKEVLDSVAAEEDETIWAAVAKAYVGIGFKLMTASLNQQFS